MSQRGIALALVALAPLLGGFSFLRGEDRDVERGNESYGAGEYEEALAHYQAAEVRGDDPALALNLGAALYRLAEASDGDARRDLFGEAAQAFERAGAAGDGATRARAQYNLGNARFRQGRYADAAAAYRASLLEDPSREDARLNLALALRSRDQQAARDARAGSGHATPAGRADEDIPHDDPAAAREPASGQTGASRQRDAEAAAARTDAEAGERERERESPEPISLDDVERKLDELERLSREIWLERIRRRARREGGEAAW